jgi:serine/threonine protein kinase
MRVVGCPEPARWQALLEEAEEDGGEWQAHLERCPRCQKVLQELAGDAALWHKTSRLLQVGRGEATPPPILEGVLAKLKSTADGSLTDPDAEVELPPDFLRPAERPGPVGMVGCYEVHEILGRGGMSIVLKAWDPQLARWVALKVLSPALAANANARKRFVREGRAAACIHHDNVLAVYGVEVSAGLPYLVLQYVAYLVLQYVAGVSLQERLDQQGPLPVKEIVHIGVQIAAGLAAAHAQGVIHRDVKPANILLEEGSGRVRVSDFGLARSVDDAGCTHQGDIVGTPLYMAPEQARGETVDLRADLYSLGAVLYTLAAGRPPFQADTTLGVLKRVTEEAPGPLRSLRPDVPPTLERFIMTLLEKRPENRYGSSVRALHWLRQYQANPEAPPQPRRPLLAAAMVLAGLLLPLLLTAAIVYSFRTPARTPVLNAKQNYTPFMNRTRPVPLHLAPASIRPFDEPLLFFGHTAPPIKVAISPKDGNQALSASGFLGDQTVRLWDFRTGEELRCFTLQPDLPLPAMEGPYPLGQEPGQWNTVAFSPDGKRAVAGNFGGLVVIWDVATGQELQRMEGNHEHVGRAIFSPDGKSVLSGSQDGMLYLWDAAGGKLLKKWVAHADSDPKERCIRELAFLPDGRHVLSASYDHTVKLWELDSQQLLRTFAGHGKWVQGLAVSRDGKWFLSGSDDIRLWNVESGELVRSFFYPNDFGITGLALSPDERRVASSCYDGSIRVWDVQTGELQLASYGAFNGWAWSVSYSPDGNYLLACGGGSAQPRIAERSADFALRKYVISAPPAVLPARTKPVSKS